MLKRKTKKLIIAFALGVLMMTFILVVMIYYFHQKLSSQQNAFDDQILSYEQQIKELNQVIDAVETVSVYITNKQINKGEVITEDNISEIRVDKRMINKDVITQKNNIVEHISKIDLKASSILMNTMITKELIPDNLRELEYNMFLLNSNLTKDMFIDIRIKFLNSEDFTVLSKKKIRDIDIDTNTIWVWLDEEEILRMNSAILDAYINGAVNYSVTYVEPYLQDNAIVNYVPNAEILELMENDPNILDYAKDELAKQARDELEDRLKGISDDEQKSAISGYNQEASNREKQLSQSIIETNKLNDQEDGDF